MRPGLLWLLIATLAASAAAIWWPQSAPVIASAALPRNQDPRAASVAGARAQASVAAAPAALPTVPLGGWHLEPARRDIFAAETAGLPQGAGKRAAAAPAPASQQRAGPMPGTAVPPPTAFAPPVLRTRYLGTFLTPGGERIVLLARGESAFSARVGVGVDDGFVIESIAEQGIRFRHPATGGVVELPVPPMLGGRPGEPAPQVPE